MKVEFVERGPITFAGMSYYGPLTGEGWSRENPIGQLWQRFNEFFDRTPAFTESRVVNPGIGYEIGIWNEEEYQESKCFYVFVGVEVDRLHDMPLELVGKVLPAGTYAHMTPQGKGISTWERAFYEEWLPGSGYRVQAHNNYQFQIQAYEEGRFHGLGDQLEESEIDVYVPVEKVA
jgi:predicted transcriptional regulator YdeE